MNKIFLVAESQEEYPRPLLEYGFSSTMRLCLLISKSLSVVRFPPLDVRILDIGDVRDCRRLN